MKEEWLKVKGSVLVSDSAYSSQNTQFGLVLILLLPILSLGPGCSSHRVISDKVHRLLVTLSSFRSMRFVLWVIPILIVLFPILNRFRKYWFYCEVRGEEKAIEINLFFFFLSETMNYFSCAIYRKLKLWIVVG